MDYLGLGLGLACGLDGITAWFPLASCLGFKMCLSPCLLRLCFVVISRVALIVRLGHSLLFRMGCFVMFVLRSLLTPYCEMLRFLLLAS